MDCLSAAAMSPRSLFRRGSLIPVAVVVAVVVSLALLASSSSSSLSPWRFGRPVPTEQLEKILAAADMGNRTVILTTMNAAWAEPGSVLDLFLESFRIGNATAALLRHMIIVAVDQKALARCRALHDFCYDLNAAGADLSAQKDYMTPDYLDMMWRRLDFQLHVLRQGYSFIATDADILWFRNPLPHFYPDGDFQISCDRFLGNASGMENWPSNGFNYVRANNRTVPFFKYWHAARARYPGDHDQTVFDRIKRDKYLEEIGLKIRFLDTKYFGGVCEIKPRDWSSLCTFHANCLIGLGNKLKELRNMLDGWRNYTSRPGVN